MGIRNVSKASVILRVLVVAVVLYVCGVMYVASEKASGSSPPSRYGAKALRATLRGLRAVRPDPCPPSRGEKFIPREIHTILGLWDINTTLTYKQKAAIDTWHKTQGDAWRVRVWRPKDLKKVLHPDTYRLLTPDSGLKHGQIADIARYALLRAVGGVYADIDIYALRNFDEWLGCPPEQCVCEGIDFAGMMEWGDPPKDNPGRREIANYIFAASKNSEVMRRALALSIKRASSAEAKSTMKAVIWSTGPRMLSDILDRILPENHDHMTAHLAEDDSRVFIIDKASADTFVNHHARGTWRNEFASWVKYGWHAVCVSCHE